MPLYEYICRECSKQFEALVYGAKRPRCPACDSVRLQQQLSVFAVAGSSKGSGFAGASSESDADSDSDSACGACGDPRGPGACSMD